MDWTSISQHAQGLGLPLPACSRLRLQPPAFPVADYSPQHSQGHQLSPGKGPCSCCKFPKIFWLSRWMRRVTTWGEGSRSPSETKRATCPSSYWVACVPITRAPPPKR